MPEIPESPPIQDLFSNFAHNWNTLMPALAVLFGVLFGGWVIRKIIKNIRGDDD